MAIRIVKINKTICVGVNKIIVNIKVLELFAKLWTWQKERYQNNVELGIIFT